MTAQKLTPTKDGRFPTKISASDVATIQANFSGAGTPTPQQIGAMAATMPGGSLEDHDYVDYLTRTYKGPVPKIAGPF